MVVNVFFEFKYPLFKARDEKLDEVVDSKRLFSSFTFELTVD